ncbi:c-type cytochrome [Hyalangium gracile]|uniref:c-type cytochrome n=1 Tax=Hyalangium gracile TaxID=394092 RepID=UPI001CCF4DD7|nr:cytochrome c [Hyalangium gracile]
MTAPTSCPEPAPRYADVAPIFQQRCVVCHNGSGGPWPLDDYGHVSDWQDSIRDYVRECIMPPSDSGVTMTVEERVAILTWLRCGLPR